MMATADSVKSKLQGLIDAANAKTGGDDADLSTAIDTLIAGFGEGEQDAASRYWDEFQGYGRRTEYGRSLRHSDFKYVKLRYPVNGNVAYMFQGCSCKEIDINGNINDPAYTFNSDSVKKIRCNLVVTGGRLVYMFHQARLLEEIGTLDITNAGSDYHNTAFSFCDSLKKVTFTGEILYDIKLDSSPLDVDSMKSVITHLRNYSGTENEYKYYVRFKPNCWNALEADSVSPTGTTWAEYVDSLGWTT